MNENIQFQAKFAFEVFAVVDPNKNIPVNINDKNNVPLRPIFNSTNIPPTMSQGYLKLILLMCFDKFHVRLKVYWHHLEILNNLV